MEFFVCFDEFYKMAKKHDGVKKIVVHFFLKSVNNNSFKKFDSEKPKFQFENLLAEFLKIKRCKKVFLQK